MVQKSLKVMTSEISNHEKVDLFMIDDTRTQGEKTSFSEKRQRINFITVPLIRQIKK